MPTVQNSYSEGFVIDCLNRLEMARNKLAKSVAASSEIDEAIKCLKQYLQTVRINKDVFYDMQKEIEALRREKEAIMLHHKQTLQNLEMLLYQNDIQELKLRINQLKAWELSKQSEAQSKAQESSNYDSKLDRAYLLEDEENEFLDCVQIASKENSPIKESLSILNSPPMQKKAEVWMEIMFSKNSEEANPHQKKRRTHELSDFSEINPTEDHDHALTRQVDRHFSGKKVKSMILLKDKVKKGNSKQKTSTKKQEGTKEPQNVESHSKLKKRILFPTSKLVETCERESGKKKMPKQCEIKAVRSFRKTLINNM